MGHVESVDIEGFKCLKSVHLECGQFNLITGRNGTGKSSVLEAIELGISPTNIGKFKNKSQDLINVENEKAEIEIISGDSAHEMQFCPVSINDKSRINKAIGIIALVINNSFGDNKEVGPDEVVSRAAEVKQDLPNNISDDLTLVKHGDDEDIYVTAGDWIGQVLASLSAAPDPDDDLFEALEQTFKSHFSGGKFLTNDLSSESVKMIEEYGHTQNQVQKASVGLVRVRDFLRDHDIFPNLESFSFDELVFDEDGEQYAIPYDFLGDGTKTIIGIVWQLVADDEIPDVVLLEEPENHLHPGYVKELVPFLIDFAREEDVQLFVTSHNVDFISELLSDSLSEDHREWLAEEFRLIQMTELSPKQFDYDRAKHHTEELHLDLRGL